MSEKKITRREMLKGLGIAAMTTGLAACAPKVVKETVIVEKSVEKVVAATPAPKEPATIMYWYFADNPEWQALHLDAIGEFSDLHPEITVQTDMAPNGNESQSKAYAAFAAGAGMPDVTEANESWLPEMYRNNMVLPVEGRAKAWEHWDDWEPAVREMSRGRPQDPIGCLVKYVMVEYNYYRVDWFEAAGLEPPDTQEDLLEAAIALTDPPDRYGYGVRGGDIGSWFYCLGHFMKGNGVEIVKRDGTVDIDSPEAIATTEWFLSFFNKHKVVQPSAVSDRFPEAFAALQNGKLGMFAHGLWSWKTFSEALGDKVSAFPKVKGKVTRWVQSGGTGPIIYSTTEHPDEAWLLASHMAQPKEALKWTKQVGGGPAFKSLADDPIFKENRFYKVALESAPYYGPYPFWQENWRKFESTYPPEFQRLVQGETNPETFCKLLAKILREG